MNEFTEEDVGAITLTVELAVDNLMLVVGEATQVVIEEGTVVDKTALAVEDILLFEDDVPTNEEAVRTFVDTMLATVVAAAAEVFPMEEGPLFLREFKKVKS